MSLTGFYLTSSLRKLCTDLNKRRDCVLNRVREELFVMGVQESMGIMRKGEKQPAYPGVGGAIDWIAAQGVSSGMQRICFPRDQVVGMTMEAGS